MRLKWVLLDRNRCILTDNQEIVDSMDSEKELVEEVEASEGGEVAEDTAAGEGSVDVENVEVVVNGEVVVDSDEAAKGDLDLDSYRIELDAYSGPLDLLMYLVRRHEIDLNDIPIASLTEQYIAHMKLLKEINVNMAAEFLVMAATLLEIKSKMIIPPDFDAVEGEEAEVEEEEIEDPRFELVQQLLAYKRYKDASIDLEDQMEEWEKRYPLKPTKYKKGDREGYGDDAEDAEEMSVELDDANMMDLCDAFTRILESIGLRDYKHEVTYDDTPLALHAEDVFDRIKRDGVNQRLTLSEIFVGRTRSEAVGLFLATLELVRQKRVVVVQDPEGGEICLEIRPEEKDYDPDAVVDWRDPETGEMQYDWPTEESRKRAARRVKIRATRARNEKLRADLEEKFPEGVPEDELIKAGLLKVTKERRVKAEEVRKGPMKLGQLSVGGAAEADDFDDDDDFDDEDEIEEVVDEVLVEDEAASEEEDVAEVGVDDAENDEEKENEVAG